MRRIAIARLVGLLIAVAAVSAAIKFGFVSAHLNSAIHQWFDHRQMEFAADLSQPFELAVPFHQTWSTSHGEAICLQLSDREEHSEEPETLLSGLSGSVSIRDADGVDVETVEIKGANSYPFQGGNDIVFARIRPLPAGDFTAAIRIDSGAPALRGKRQSIDARYQVGGLQQLPAIGAGAFAVVSGILGVFAALFVAPGLFRHGFRKPRQPQPAGSIETAEAGWWRE